MQFLSLLVIGFFGHIWATVTRSPSKIQSLPNELLEVINDQLSLVDGWQLAQTSRHLYENSKVPYKSIIAFKRDQPDCIFGELAQDSTRKDNFIRQAFEFFTEIHSKKWVLHKLGLPCPNFLNRTPFELAVAADNAIFIQQAIDFGLMSLIQRVNVQIAISHPLVEGTLPNIVSFVQTGYRFYLAVKRGDIRTVQSLLAQLNSLPVFSINFWHPSETPLHAAIRNNNERLVRLLIDSGANLEVVNDNDMTPLLLAATLGHSNLLDLFLKSGADVEATSLIGQTALVIAASNGWDDCVTRLLRSGASTKKFDNRGWTALHAAASAGERRSCELLVDADPSVLLQRENANRTPAHLARDYDHEQLSECLSNMESRFQTYWVRLFGAAKQFFLLP
jgi:ankyrin repeat protein